MTRRQAVALVLGVDLDEDGRIVGREHLDLGPDLSGDLDEVLHQLRRLCQEEEP